MWTWMILRLLPAAVLWSIAGEDRKYGRIPRSRTGVLFAVAVLLRTLTGVWDPTCGWLGELGDGLLGSAAALILMLTAARILKGRGIGAGDIRLAAAGGMLLGPELILRGILTGCLLSLPRAVGAARKGRRSFPMGPGLSGGIYVWWLVMLMRKGV